jgi:ABC-type cobalamin/Fe3+-siderophores transport system ATPase subunit
VKLAQVEVRNYRSLFMDGERAFTVELADGINALIGPNNCGKSNVLRAVALALDPNFPFDRERDKPADWQWAWTRVTLDFRCDGRQSYEKTLLRYADEYERSTNEGKYLTYASRGLLRLTVVFEGNAAEGANRREYLVAGGAGNRIGDAKLLDRALKQFHSSLRFVLVESGQDLQSVLAGNFRDILRNVIRDHLREQFEGADRRRSGYVESLQGSLLLPLRDRIQEVVTGLFPEVTDVTLVPWVSSIDETLSNVTVNVKDAIDTSLAAKGTGVRGAVLVAMLRYLADQTRRSLVFAVEEPEAFLHPGAQEALRDDVEKLAERPDVSILITTHSPFVVSRNASAKVVALAKDAEGRTFVSGQAMGDESHASLLGGLFRDAALPDILERAARLPGDASGAVIVEGLTDEQFIRTAALRCKRPDLVRDLYISPAGGAEKAAVQAVLIKAQSAKPVLALLDDDPPGKAAYDMLKKRFGFHKDRELLSYREVMNDNNIGAEAEDLFPPNLMDAFVKEKGEERVIKSKVARKGGGWRYDLNLTGKESIGDFVEARAKPVDLELWLKLIEMIRERLGLNVAGATDGLAGAGQAEGSSGQARWSWEAYAQELHTSPQRIEVGRALVRALEDATAAAGLPCTVRFRKGYVAFQRPGGYNVFQVDLYWRRPPRLLVVIPDDPLVLGLTDPYPELVGTWTPSDRQWDWTVPTVERIPDVGKLLPIARRFHFDHGPSKLPVDAVGDGSTT